MLQVHSSSQSRAADARAIAELGCSGFDLMLRAGRFAFGCLLAEWPAARSVSVLAGKGNNAGDGYVIAALARELGLDARVIQVGPAPDRGDALHAVEFARQRAVPVEPFEAAATRFGDVIVDALLGTGQSGPLRGEFHAAVAAINASARPVLAVDVPTGLNADTGGACGEDPSAVVRATVTATFITRKFGQYTGLGREVCGHLRHDSLGVPASLLGEGVDLVCDLLPRPALSANAWKHQRGHVVVCGGDRNMGGAVLLAGEAALRAGAGMVTVVTRPEHRAAILARRPELMVMDAEDQGTVAALLERASCVVLGPGLDRHAWGAALYALVAAATTAPVLLDADGFHHWLAAPDRLRPAVVTPHVAEAARLLGVSTARVQHDRPAAVRSLVQRVSEVAVLKGAGSLIASRDRMTVCGAGNPGMATAGMGDVLSGVIAAQLPVSADAYEASRRGVVMHAIAGDRAASRLSQTAMLASDVIAELSHLP